MEGFDLTGIVDGDLLVYNSTTTNFEPAASTTLAINASQVSGLSEAAQDATAALIQNGTGISWVYNDGANTLTPTVTLAPFSTTNLVEGTNLYFTDERAQDAVGATLTDTASVDLSYDDGAGQTTATVLPAGVNHNALANYVANEHINHTSVTLTAGAGLTGGGDISANRTFDVGAGTGITVNANDVAVNLAATFAWTNQHTFSLAGNTATPTVLLSSTQPVFGMDETDQAADEKRWIIVPVAKVLQFRATTDNGSASIIWGRITRGTGTAISDIAFGDTTNNNTYTFNSTGLTTFSGAVTTTGAALGKSSIRSDNATAGVGYATGAGGAVTQITSRTTGVTLNKVCGAITLVSAAGSTSWQSFTVTNSAVAATDVVTVCQKSGTDKNMIHVTAVAAGSFEVTFATTGGTTVEQPVFNFSIIKAVAA